MGLNKCRQEREDKPPLDNVELLGAVYIEITNQLLNPDQAYTSYRGPRHTDLALFYSVLLQYSHSIVANYEAQEQSLVSLR
jgi:hypothetical protein